jgi:short-subunit dehydrogenase involved in D-alanine esterification of teichoic acids
MLAMPTFQGIQLTENTILFTGIGRGPAEAFHTLGHNVIIAGLREEVDSHGGEVQPH